MSWTRERVKQRLVARFYTRFHMSLILASSAMAAMVTSWILLQMGVGSMLARYPVAVAAAYLTFLGCVGLWLRYVGVHRPEEGRGSRLDGKDLADIPLPSGSGGSGGSVSLPNLPRGGGGSFDGGGASAAWAEGAKGAVNARAPMMAAVADAEGSGVGSEVGKELGELAGGADGDFVLVVLAIAVIVAILASSGYLIFMAPDILTEAAFGALLAGALAKGSRREDRSGWVSGVVKKTWWPFALVLVVALIFAAYSEANYPQARTFREALSLALG